jgi:pyruvate kinase
MTVQILSTLGPGSLNKDTVQALAQKGVNLFRINLSHTALGDVEGIISNIQSWTDVVFLHCKETYPRYFFGL